MSTLARLCVLLAALAAGTGACAQDMVTEVVPVGYRTVDEILPILRPLVPPPGSISGISNQLVIRTTPENLQEIKHVLASLDRPPHNLIISVRRGGFEETHGASSEVFGTIRRGNVTLSAGNVRERSAGGGAVISGGEGDSRAGARIRETRTRSEDRTIQRLRVLEGHEAFIQAGQQVPYRQRDVIVSGGAATTRDSVQFQDVTSGFYVRPRLSGDRVFVDIIPRSAHLERGSGNIAVNRAQTTVSGRLGEWIEIGGVGEQRSRGANSNIYSTSRADTAGDQSIYLMVEDAGK